MIKLTKRKGFNFFRSYFDVYNELETIEDKVAFIDALLDRQFLGIKPTNLTGMAKFAYISQTNSIDSQVKGYEDKTKTILTPTQGGSVGGCNTPTLQVEVKEKVKEQLITTTTKEIIKIDEAVKECLKDDNWKLEIQRIYKVDSNKVQYALDEFKSHCVTIGKDVPRSLSMFKSHFTNWVRVKKQYQLKS